MLIYEERTRPQSEEGVRRVGDERDRWDRADRWGEIDREEHKNEPGGIGDKEVEKKRPNDTNTRCNITTLHEAD